MWILALMSIYIVPGRQVLNQDFGEIGKRKKALFYKVRLGVRNGGCQNHLDSSRQRVTFPIFCR